MPTNVKLDTTKLRKITEGLEREAQQLIDKTAYDIKGGAQDAAPVRTGFLKNSIAVEIGKLVDRVIVSAEYGAHVEFGTRYMRARPYLIPAFERFRDSFIRAWGELFK